MSCDLSLYYNIGKYIKADSHQEAFRSPLPSAHRAETVAILPEREREKLLLNKISRRLILSSRANTDETAIFQKVGQLPRLSEIGF